MTAILDSTITVTRSVQIPARRIWDVCTEPISTVSGHWIKSMRTNPLNIISIEALNGEISASAPRIDGNGIAEYRPLFIEYVLNPRHIIQSFETAVQQGLTHCGSYLIEDLDYSDACTSDLVLQIACYGRVIY